MFNLNDCSTVCTIYCVPAQWMSWERHSMPASCRKFRVRCFPAVQLNYFIQEFQSTLEFLADAGYICRKAAVFRDRIKWTLIFKGSVCLNQKIKMFNILKVEIWNFNQQTRQRKLKWHDKKKCKSNCQSIPRWCKSVNVTPSENRIVSESQFKYENYTLLQLIQLTQENYPKVQDCW
jgi:hypothetical protein